MFCRNATKCVWIISIVNHGNLELYIIIKCICFFSLVFSVLYLNSALLCMRSPTCLIWGRPTRSKANMLKIIFLNSQVLIQNTGERRVHRAPVRALKSCLKLHGKRQSRGCYWMCYKLSPRLFKKSQPEKYFSDSLLFDLVGCTLYLLLAHAHDIIVIISIFLFLVVSTNLFFII